MIGELATAQEACMVPYVALAIAALTVTATTARAEDPGTEASPPPYVAAPAPTGDAKSTIVSGILMIVNGVIMSEADRRHQQCATFIAGLQRDGFPIFRQACRTSAPR
jgi:hypothetical protein